MAEMLSDFGHIIGLNGSTQVAVMPTYSTVAVGTIVQYVGATDANYTNGYFYKATASGWEVVDVQGEDTDKADKVDSATAGNLAGLNANGNLTDAGWSADKTTSNASGNPISISGLKSNQLAMNPVITLEPIQAGSGDPSPSNVRAISGYDKIEVLSCGKNLISGYQASKSINGSGQIVDNTGACLSNKIFILQNTYYTLSFTKNVSATVLHCFDKNNNYLGYVQLSNVTFITSDLPTGVLYIYIQWNKNGEGDILPTNGQLEIGQESTTYEPYKEGCDIQLTLGQTIYGGTLDVEKGILRVDRAYYTFDGTETVAEKDIYSRFWINLPSYEPVCATATTDISSHFKNSNGTSGMEDMGGSVADISWENPKRTVYICKNSNISTTADMTAWLTTQYNNGTPLQICYAIKNPYTIQLTPHEISLLKDYAYVSTNGTNMSFSYKNGEMASLGDVAQLGETVNLLGDVKADNDSILFKSSGTFYGSSTTVSPFIIPRGAFSFQYSNLSWGDTKYLHFKPISQHNDISFTVYTRGSCVNCNYVVDENQQIYIISGYYMNGTALSNTQWYTDSNQQIATWVINPWDDLVFIGYTGGAEVWVNNNSNT